ncbi:MAG: cysteine--tRNA ligase [Candidatus Omnitrophota bacterium]|nr:cysteine--tRNA ligase [Candidatus Omnitrophota bacterium]
MKIKNSLSGKLEKLEPLKPPEVNMYTCGVTVYDACHIGHARSLYIFDVMRRYLEYKGFKVNFVRNITDIDDKIINRANELKIDWKELVEKYIQSYREDLKSLGIRSGMTDKDGEEPRAAKNIEDIKKYIQVLIDKGHAYVTATGVYFSVRKFKDYGKLSGQSIDQMLTGVRKKSDETKEDPLDFALWKRSKPDEPSWPSQWGSGRPGWHIECSVMSTKYLKTDTLDIHAGGRDLIFPHHENEIAQSEAKSGKQFAKYWIHHGLLTIDGQKMSKSLGNFITIKDFLNKHKDPDYLKLFFLSANYSSPIDYTEEKILEAKKEKERFLILFEKLNRVQGSVKNKLPPVPCTLHPEIEFTKRFEEAMDDDFNSPMALAVLFELVTCANKILQGKDSFTNDEACELFAAKKLIVDLLGVLGLSFDKPGDIDSEMAAMIKERDRARSEKDFKKADLIRKKMEEKGIILEDSKDGTTIWRRKI